MRALASELGHPEHGYPTLLVAGTNGKGSVVAYLDAALRAAGLKVGRYTSPHLIDVRERIAVDGRPIAEAALDRAIAGVRDAGRRLLARGAVHAEPTYFEALTGAAFLYFRERKVDVAVLEAASTRRTSAIQSCRPSSASTTTTSAFSAVRWRRSREKRPEC